MPTGKQINAGVLNNLRKQNTSRVKKNRQIKFSNTTGHFGVSFYDADKTTRNMEASEADI